MAKSLFVFERFFVLRGMEWNGMGDTHSSMEQPIKFNNCQHDEEQFVFFPEFQVNLFIYPEKLYKYQGPSSYDEALNKVPSSLPHAKCS